MKDLFGKRIAKGDVVLYGNNSGFITLAIVVDMKEGELHVIKRGYRDSKVERDLLFPNNTLVLTEQAVVADADIAASPDEIRFIQIEREKFMKSL